MSRHVHVVFLSALILGAPLVTGCARVGVKGTASIEQPAPTVKKHGPPPHAPAHGYRHKMAEGHDLVYDTKLGVYVVVGLADHYYVDGVYYRYVKTRWETGTEIDGTWRLAVEAALPPGLKHASKERSGKKVKEVAAADD